MPISKEELVRAMDEYDFSEESKKWVVAVSECCPEWGDVLSQVTDKNGNRVFETVDICSVYNCCYKDLIKNPEKVKAVLSDEEALEDISGFRNKGVGLQRNVREPLPSVKSRHPDVFAEKDENKDVKTSDKKKSNNVCFYKRGGMEM